MQDQIVRRNVVFAQEMRKEIQERGYNLDNVRIAAHQIYRDGLSLIQAEVQNRSPLSESLIAVVIELNGVTSLSHIQLNLNVLIPVLKAHRAMTELTWVNCWKNGNQPIYNHDREAIFTIANQLKPIIPKVAKIERKVFVSPGIARYELACLEQSAKCLDPGEGVWTPFFATAFQAAEGAATINITQLFSSVADLMQLAHQERIADWYIEMFPLEWKATCITTLSEFQKEFEPLLKNLTEKGNHYTLGLVKILALIFQNEKSEPELKEKAFKELLNLLVLKPSYTIFDNLRNKLDRYADTRSFAAHVLIDIASKNDAYRPRVEEGLEKWYEALQEKKYIEEKRVAKLSRDNLNQKHAALDTRRVDLEGKLEEALAEDRAEALDPDQLASEIVQVEEEQAELQKQIVECTKQIELVDSIEEEVQLLKDLKSNIGSVECL